MRFALQLTIGIDREQAALRPRYEAFRRQVALAGETGFEGIFHGQWFVRESTSVAQPMPVLASIAHEAWPMTVGTGILQLPLLHPIDVAEQAATMDVITDGRFILGVGAGYGDEIEAFEVDRRTRGKRLEESLEIIKRLWAAEPVSFHGEHYRIRRVAPMVAPVQKPRPRIWLAASADVAVRRAARVADACFFGPHVTLATVKRQVELFESTRRGLPGAGPPDCIPLMREVFVAKTRERARQLAEEYLIRSYRDLYVQHGQDKVMPPGEEDFTRSFEELARDRFVLGDPDDARREFERYHQIGVDYLVLHMPHFGMPDHEVEECIRLLGSEVLPALR